MKLKRTVPDSGRYRVHSALAIGNTHSDSTANFSASRLHIISAKRGQIVGASRKDGSGDVKSC